VLTEDGVVLMDTPNEGALVRKISFLMYRLLGGRVPYPANKLYHPFHRYYFSEASIRSLLDLAGFDVIEITTKPIPAEKGRGRRLERSLVSMVAAVEKPLGMGFEMIVLARRKRIREETLTVPCSARSVVGTMKLVSCAA